MYTVYIVDDERVIREGLRKLLDWEALGYAVAGDAASAEEALGDILTLRPDVLITDIKMNGLNGIGLIHNLRGRGYTGEIIVISGYADFSYARSAIRYGVKSYLLKPIDERELAGELYALHRLLDKKGLPVRNADDKLRSEYEWQKFLRGTGAAPSALPKQSGALRVALFTPMPGANVPDDDQLRAVFTRLASKGGITPLYCLAGQCAALTALDEEQLEDCLSGCAQTLKEQAGFDCGCAAGLPVRSAEKLAESCADARALLEHRFLFGSRRVLTGMPNKNAAPLDEEDTAERLVSIISNRDEHALRELMSEWRDAMIYSRSDEISVKVGLSGLMTQVLSRLSARYPEVPSHTYDRQSLMERIHLAPDINNLTDIFGAHMLAIADALAALLPDEPMLRAVDYIRHHYADSLSLNAVAARFHYNRVYFGRKFKSYTGLPFAVYLDDLRIEKSKPLLQRGYKVYQVSNMVGFSSVDSFTEKFRRREGVPPGEYRRASGEGEIEAVDSP